MNNFIPKNSYNSEEIAACTKGYLFGAGNCRLPSPNMLMVNRITEINSNGGEFSKGLVLAELDIQPDMWFFDCHFPDDPVMPGCLGLDGLWQLTGFYLAWRGNQGHGRALGAGEVKFFGQVLPTSRKVTYRIDISRIVERKLVMAIGNGAVFVDGRQIYAAKDLRVGLFTSTDNF